MKADEFTVSIQVFEGVLDLEVGKWNARFIIKREGKNLYYGAILRPADSEEQARRDAAAEVCRILSNGAKLLY
ncbi:MAG: hypothetical protein EOO81_12950 [Oxalobacteraceae bacterium]|nr:MAG: hypothetical protein EOO81_12950 [Oxalobacteraceae bacterium]